MEVLTPFERKSHAKMTMEDSFRILIEEMAYSAYSGDIEYFRKKYIDIIGEKRFNEIQKLISVILPVQGAYPYPESDEGGADNG